MKKMLSIVLALVLAICLCVPAFATDEVTSESQIRCEIQSEKVRVFQDVYAQLEMQDATSLMPVYEELLTPEIEMNIRAKYASADSDILLLGTYTGFTYGGAIGYTSSLDATVLITALDYDNSYYYVLLQNSFTIGTVIQTILGNLMNWGLPFSGLFLLTTTVSQSACNSIIAADGFAKIINVESGTDSGSVLTGWSNHPNITIPNDSTGIHTKYFPQHDPWA